MAIDDAGAPRLVVTEPAERVGLVLSLPQPEMVIRHSDTADVVLDDRFVSGLPKSDPAVRVPFREWAKWSKWHKPL
jgi:hypothetical protein